MAEPDNPDRQYWLLDGENLGPKFPSPNEKEAEEHVKRFGREVGTPVRARELSDVTQRLKHLNELGIDVQVLYNSLWLRPLTRRPDVEIALCWSWNRWLAGVWKLGENRLRWTCVVPALTPEEAVPQVRFAKEHGAVGVCMRPFEQNKLMTDPFYYPIYDEAQRLDIPVTVHIANGNPELFKLMTNESGGGFSTFRIPTVTACYALIMSEIPRVFPKLLGFYRDIEPVGTLGGSRGRAAVFRERASGFHQLFWRVQHLRFHSDRRRFSIHYVLCGRRESRIGTDYGHGDTSSELNAISRFKAMGGLSPEVKRKILSDNPKRFYGI